MTVRLTALNLSNCKKNKKHTFSFGQKQDWETFAFPCEWKCFQFSFSARKVWMPGLILASPWSLRCFTGAQSRLSSHKKKHLFFSRLFSFFLELTGTAGKQTHCSCSDCPFLACDILLHCRLVVWRACYIALVEWCEPSRQPSTPVLVLFGVPVKAPAEGGDIWQCFRLAKRH